MELGHVLSKNLQIVNEREQSTHFVLLLNYLDKLGDGVDGSQIERSDENGHGIGHVRASQSANL